MLDIDDYDREEIRDIVCESDELVQAIKYEILNNLEITMTNPSEPGATPRIALTYDGEVISSI
jgi:hypothetical protein